MSVSEQNLNHLEWASGTVILWLEAICSLGRRLMTSSCLLVTTFLWFMRLPLSNNTLGNLYRYLLLQAFPVHLGLRLGRHGGCVTLLSLFSLSHPPAHPLWKLLLLLNWFVLCLKHFDALHWFYLQWIFLPRPQLTWWLAIIHLQLHIQMTPVGPACQAQEVSWLSWRPSLCLLVGESTKETQGLTRKAFLVTRLSMGFPGGSVSKQSACNAGDPGSISGLGRSPGEGNYYPNQYSCLENSIDRGGWWATFHGVAKSWTWLSD